MKRIEIWSEQAVPVHGPLVAYILLLIDFDTRSEFSTEHKGAANLDKIDAFDMKIEFVIFKFFSKLQ